ncbi:hypothetical protein FQN57_003788, partial [Myotisia sp. PD_48]
MAPRTRSRRPKQPPVPLPRRETSSRQHYHKWTDEELNLLIYGRARGWSYAQIQRTHFPSYTIRSLTSVYLRMTTKERARRALITAKLPDTSQGGVSMHPDPVQELRHSPRSLSQPEDNIEAPGSFPLRYEKENMSPKSINCAGNRYNLRPKRCSNYRVGKPLQLVDSPYFPHFFKSYKNHIKAHGLPDRDYIPPSHSPMLESSDRSPSIISSLPSAASSLELFGLETRSISSSDRTSSINISHTMTAIAKFEQFGLNTFYNAIPTLDNASDWFQWNQKVNEFVRISAVADDGATLPIEEEEAQQWTHRQKFYSAMIAAKLTHNAAQRIKASEISQVQSLIKAVKDNFKPEGTGTYVNLQRQYMSLTREKCGSAQALGAEIRKIHAEKLLLDPDCATSEIERTFFFMHALGSDHMFRQMDLVNERDADGTIIKAAPSFDYIENKAIEEEHRKSQLGKRPTEVQALPALALTRGPGNKKLIPSPDGNTCRIEIDNVPYCSFCRKPYHIDSECFSKNPRLKDQRRDGKGQRSKPGSSSMGARKLLKRKPATDDEEDD